METFLIKEQYKVIQVLYMETHYCALQAVDIKSRSNDLLILNVYEDPLLKPYVALFHAFRNLADLVEIFVRDGSLVAVFRSVQGEPIDRCFYLGDRRKAAEASLYADTLFKQVIGISDYPPEISCAMLHSDQLLFRETEKKFHFNPIIFPLEEMNKQELAFLLRDQILKILHKRPDTVYRERLYLRSLRRTSAQDVLALYREWETVWPEIQEEEKRLSEAVPAVRILSIIWINIKDFFAELFCMRKVGRK